MEESLQEIYAPSNVCFGCGPANADGLRVRSFPQEDGTVVASWTPQRHLEAAPGMLNGGIIGTLLDCHANWTGIWHLMRQQELTAPPPTVTVEYRVEFHQPTPTDQGALDLYGRAIETGKRKAVVEAELHSSGTPCATFRGTFVVVPPDHLAYGRW